MRGYRQAFSLMELMIVIVIVGIVYAMALTSFKAPDPKKLEAFSMMTLPSYLRENFSLMDTKLVCFEPCGKCQILVDGEWMEDELDLFSSSDVKSYELDFEGFAVEKEFAPQDMEDAYKGACFILHKRSNGSISPIVLQQGDEYIYYKAGYEEPERYSSLADIQSEYQKVLNAIRDTY